VVRGACFVESYALPADLVLVTTEILADGDAVRR
jgi:hypothetical protein